jgi:hypothetical protein
MMQIEPTVTAGPRLSRSEDALPHGLRVADPAEQENVEGGWGIFETIDRISAAVTGGLLGAYIYDKLHS